MISFIIPAYNEELWVGRCISAIHGAMNGVREAHEIIVVDDSSTDNTFLVAQQHGVKTIRGERRNIAATRNEGAKHAIGDIFFFVDADTLVNSKVIQSALGSIFEGAVGGGCVPQFEGRIPLWWKIFYPFLVAAIRLLRLPGGSCQFCTREAFEAVGGFSEAHYAAEDALFDMALKEHGRFIVLTEGVITSGRSLRSHSFWSIARILTRLALFGPDGFRNRKGLDLWYRPKREKF